MSNGSEPTPNTNPDSEIQTQILLEQIGVSRDAYDVLTHLAPSDLHALTNLSPSNMNALMSALSYHSDNQTFAEEDSVRGAPTEGRRIADGSEDHWRSLDELGEQDTEDDLSNVWGEPPVSAGVVQGQSHTAGLYESEVAKSSEVQSVEERLSPEELHAAETIAQNNNIAFGLYYSSHRDGGVKGVSGNDQRSKRLGPLKDLPAQLQYDFDRSQQITDQSFSRVSQSGIRMATKGMYHRIGLGREDWGRSLAWSIDRDAGTTFTVVMMDPDGGSRPGINCTFTIPNSLGLAREVEAIKHNPDVLLAIFGKAFPGQNLSLSNRGQSMAVTTTKELANRMRTPEVFSDDLIAAAFPPSTLR